MHNSFWDIIDENLINTENSESHNKSTIKMIDDAMLVFLRRPFGKRRDVLRIREDSWADNNREETLVTTIVLREELQRLGENGLPIKKKKSVFLVRLLLYRGIVVHSESSDKLSAACSAARTRQAMYVV